MCIFWTPSSALSTLTRIYYWVIEVPQVHIASNVQVTCAQVSVVITTAAETIKLSVWAQVSAVNFNVINDDNYRSKVLCEKLN